MSSQGQGQNVEQRASFITTRRDRQQLAGDEHEEQPEALNGRHRPVLRRLLPAACLRFRRRAVSLFGLNPRLSWLAFQGGVVPPCPLPGKTAARPI